MKMTDHHNYSETVQWGLANDHWFITGGFGSSSEGGSELYGYDGGGYYSRRGGTLGNSWTDSGTLVQSGEIFDESSYSVNSFYLGGLWSTTGSGGSSGHDYSDSSYIGGGEYTSTYSQNGIEYSFSGSGSHDGYDSSHVDYSTSATLLDDETWNVTGSGSDEGSSGKHSSYEGSGTFKMRVEDGRVTEPSYYTGSVSHNGTDDFDSSWNAGLSFQNGTWFLSSGSGDSDVGYSSHVEFNGKVTTDEVYVTDHIRFSTSTDRTVEGRDSGHSDTTTYFSVVNGIWVTSGGDGTGGGSHYLKTTYDTSGSYTYKTGDSNNGMEVSGGLPKGENYGDRTNSADSDYEYLWDNGWQTTGTTNYTSSENHNFKSTGSGTFWNNHGSGDNYTKLSGTVSEEHNSNSHFDAVWAEELHADGTVTLLSGEIKKNTAHDDTKTTWASTEGSFKQVSYGLDGSRTSLSGTLNHDRTLKTEYDFSETKKVKNHQWELETGSSKNWYDNDVTDGGSGNGTMTNSGGSFTVTQSWRNHSNPTVEYKGKVAKNDDNKNEWTHSGESFQNDDGDSSITVVLQTGTYKRDISGGSVSGTVTLSRTVSDDYDNHTKSVNKGEGTPWELVSGSLDSGVTIEYSQTYKGGGSYNYSRYDETGSTWIESLSGTITESGGNSVTAPNARITQTYDADKKQWNEEEGEGSITYKTDAHFSDEGSGSFFVAGGEGKIAKRNSGYDYEYTETEFLDSGDRDYDSDYQVSDAYEATVTRDSYNNMSGTYEWETNYNNRFHAHLTWSVDVWGNIDNDYSGDRDGEGHLQLKEKFELGENGNDTYDSYLYDTGEKYDTDFDEDLNIDPITLMDWLGVYSFEDLIFEDWAWSPNTKNDHGEFSFKEEHKKSNINNGVTNDVEGISFTGTEKTSEDYRYSKSLQMDIKFTSSNGETKTGDGSETFYHEKSSSFDGEDQTYEYYDSEGTQKGEKSSGSTIDTTLEYQWDKDTAQWHVTGTGKMKSKIGYSWSDIADGSQSDGITIETFSRNNSGDFLDDVTADWSYNNQDGGWTADTVTGGRGGSYRKLETYNASRSGDGGSGAVYNLEGLNTTFDDWTYTFDTSNSNSVRESMTIAYYVSDGTICRITDGTTTVKSDSETKLSDTASYNWEDHQEIIRTRDHWQSYTEGTRTTDQEIERTLKGNTNTENHSKSVLTWTGETYSDGRTKIESTCEVDSEAKFYVYYRYFEENDLETDLDEYTVYVYDSSDSHYQYTSDTQSHSKNNSTIERTETYDQTLILHYQIDNDGNITDKTNKDTITADGTDTRTADSNGSLDYLYESYSTSTWGTYSGRRTEEHSGYTDNRTDIDDYVFMNGNNTITLTTTGARNTFGERYQYSLSTDFGSYYNLNESTTPLNDNTPYDNHEQLSSSSPGFSQHGVVAVPLLITTPLSAGVMVTASASTATPPGQKSIKVDIPLIDKGAPGYGNFGIPDVDAILNPPQPTATIPATPSLPSVSSGEEPNLFNRVFGVIQVIGGAVQTVAGGSAIITGLGLAPGTCGTSLVVTAAGGIVALNGLDNVQAGLRQAWTGKSAQTLTSSAVESATGSHIAGEIVDAGIGMISPGGVLKFAQWFKKTCFTAGTQIVVGTEYNGEGSGVEYVTVNIEDIKVGDLVYSYDTITGEVSQKIVTDTFVRVSNHIRYLTTVDEEGDIQIFETTDSHPFWIVTDDPDLSRAAGMIVDENGTILYHENINTTEQGYYVEAKDLKVGDVFIGANGELTTLADSYRKDFPNGITVYNFTVADNHNYFVIANLEAFQNGEQPILVHNSSYKLAKNMQAAGTYRHGDQAAHHLVAENHRDAAEARGILQKHNIDINSHWNGVYLPRQKNMLGTYHNGGHSKSYFEVVNEKIANADKAGGKTAVLKTLQEIRQKLASGNMSL